jgi:hypothetical protein
MGPSSLIQLQSNSKIRIFDGKVIVAATGAVGFSQRLDEHVQEAIKGGVFNLAKRRECITNISRRVLTDFQQSIVSPHPQLGIKFGALIATVHGGEPFLAEYDPANFQPEIKEGNIFFVSMGSGQMLADPFLAFVARVMWSGKMPTVADAKFGVFWALQHAISLAPGGVGGPIVIATLQKINNVWVAVQTDENQELEQYIADLEGHIGAFARKSIQEAPAAPVPVPDKPVAYPRNDTCRHRSGTGFTPEPHIRRSRPPDRSGTFPKFRAATITRDPSSPETSRARPKGVAFLPTADCTVEAHPVGAPRSRRA